MKRKTRDNAPPSASLQPTDLARSTTRRAFLRKVGKQAIYVAPVVAALTASQVQAASGPSGSSCLPDGEPCIDNSDCCSGICAPGTMLCTMS